MREEEELKCGQRSACGSEAEGGGVPPQAARVEVGAVGLEIFGGAGALGFTSFHLVVWSPNFY